MLSPEKFFKMIAHLPFRMRRRVLYCVWRAGLPFRKKVGYGLVPLLERYLRLDSISARQIDRVHEFHDFLQIMEWFASCNQSTDSMISASANMKVSDEPLINRLAGSGEPVILAPLHMGVFAFGITYVVWKYFSGRRVLVLRAREDLEENNESMARLREIASEVMILNTRNESEFMGAMRFARKGAVVISLIDLPATYGSPVESILFGEEASIAMGLDAMARMLKAVVLPMTVCSSLRGDEIVFGEPFEVWENSPEERALLARKICRQMEAFIRMAPEQWHMWTRIDEFYPKRFGPVQPAVMDENGAENHVAA